ncbi:hypothetical protein A4A49_58661, partial [Nicotiana attenuata]
VLGRPTATAAELLEKPVGFHVSAGNTEGQELEGSDAMDGAAATGVRTVHEQDKHSQKSAMVQPNAGFNIGHNQVNASKESDGSCSNVQKGNKTLTVEARPSNMILHDKDGYTNEGYENWSVKEAATGFKEMFTETKNSQKIALEQTNSLDGVVRLTEVSTTTAGQFSNDQNQASKGAKTTAVTAEAGAQTAVTADAGAQTVVTADAGHKRKHKLVESCSLSQFETDFKYSENQAQLSVHNRLETKNLNH